MRARPVKLACPPGVSLHRRLGQPGRRSYVTNDRLGQLCQSSRAATLQLSVGHSRNLIDRVQLKSGGIRVSLNLKRLIAEPIDAGDSTGLTMTRFIPMEMKRGGGESRLVTQGEAARVLRS